MTHIQMNRFHESSVQTRAHLVVYDSKEKNEVLYSCYTLELPWRDNENQVSCIPEGDYIIRHREARESQSYNYPHFKVLDVEGRSYILMHAGNLYTHTLGCILPGLRFNDINKDGHPDVVGSRQALKEIRSCTARRSTLSIRSLKDYAKSVRPKLEPSKIRVSSTLDESTWELDANYNITQLA